ncbi:hypothetical protein [Alkalibacter mobilis]|uniref:hypothetical protein n=1 Tax=Alkalibacter mobilis TaxID=2787712 RepID=UPI00189D56ED|nr:hypothetical protein [Alkalibacter mobilis]MBF7096782.1 hypothetical protein [Alkalibacter mobilis]
MKNKRTQGIMFWALGLAMLLFNAVNYLMGLGYERPSLTIIGVGLLFTGLNILRKNR